MNRMHRTRQTVAAFSLAALAAHAWAVDTPIYTIQGSGNTSPLVGQTVTTTGVVTKLTNNGFFLQDPTGDGDPLTSDGIFVFSSTAPTVTAGQYVRLTGLVTEFNVGSAANPDTLAHRVTELTTITGLAVLGNGFSLTPALVTLPEGVNDELEHYEGMLVTLQGPLTVGQNFFQARYGQLTLSAGGRLETPTNRYRPGLQAQALADENARRRILLDDGRSTQNPNPTPYLLANGTPRGGDTVASITGVIDYGLATASNTGFGDYKIHPTVVPVFTASHPRTATPPGVGGNVKLASFNVLNFFTTFTNGQTATGQTGQGCTLGASTAAGNCRGADNLAEFIRQRTKIVEALAAVNADAVGLMEIQNNGAAPQNLVDALNARVGAGTYAVVPDPATGTGTDAIKVAMIYKPGRLSPAAPSSSDTAAIHNRPPLAQTFAAANGERFTLIVNHFKSKGSCPAAGDADAQGNVDLGDGQGCWNLQRVQQAQALRSFVAALQTSAGSNDVLLVGDFNAYGQEDPVFDLTGSGYVDQIGRYNTLGYSYVFDGAAGRLDHAITTGPMSPKVAFATHWHINADEAVFYDYNLEFKAPATTCGGLCPPDAYQPDAYKASDHDPVVLGLNLYKTVRSRVVRGAVVGTVGDDILIGGPGANTLTGNGGANVFVYESLRDAGDSITDFVPGTDRLDFGPLLASLGYTGTDPVADGWVRFVALPRNATSVMVDPDGPGPAAARSMVTLLGVRFATLSGPRDLKPGAAPAFRPVPGAPLR
jgi:predicted extracellular nuclease